MVLGRFWAESKLKIHFCPSNLQTNIKKYFTKHYIFCIYMKYTLELIKGNGCMTQILQVCEFSFQL